MRLFTLWCDHPAVIEFGDGPTNEQVHELFQETTALLTMLTYPGLHGAEEIDDQTQRTYAVSPPYALAVLASIGAGRAWRQIGDVEPSRAVGRFPRDVLQTVPTDRRPDLLLVAIDLIEAVAAGRLVRELVDQLLVDGMAAYRILVAVTHELGWLAARVDPTLKRIADLAAVEAVAAEMDWYASQDE